MCETTNFKHAPCPTCLGKVSGRRDKIYCSVKCKNEHHRVARNYLKPYLGEINERIRRNFVILEGAVGTNANKVMIHQSSLFKYGFDFKTCNRSYRKNKKLYYEVGNFEYRFLNNGLIFIERLKALSSIVPIFFRRWLIEFPTNLEVLGNENRTKKAQSGIQSQSEKTRFNE